MGGDPQRGDRAGERARRRAARETIAAYHDEQLRVLLEYVREGFTRLDAGEIDAFELDELIRRRGLIPDTPLDQATSATGSRQRPRRPKVSR